MRLIFGSFHKNIPHRLTHYIQENGAGKLIDQRVKLKVQKVINFCPSLIDPPHGPYWFELSKRVLLAYRSNYMLVSILLDEDVWGVADVLELIEADCERSIVLFLWDLLLDGGTRAPRYKLAIFIGLFYCLVKDSFWDRKNLWFRICEQIS